MVTRDEHLRYAETVFTAHTNWDDAPWLTLLAVLLFARRERIVQLGWRVTIGWWRGAPYLISMKEPRS